MKTTTALYLPSALVVLLVMLTGTLSNAQSKLPPRSYSGIYPHLAYYNHEGECGTGVVIPWAERLWIATYAPHSPYGSDDKLYEITPDLHIIPRPESIGGTPANRMIHRESGQLFIAHYAIDKQRNVRTIPFVTMPGRLTGSARHLTDPANKIYTATMEEGFYEINVHDLSVKMLYEDNNISTPAGPKPNRKPQLLPGAHGKGLYSGQGVLIYSNNGEYSAEARTNFDTKSGALAEWNGKDWLIARRNQFVEVTGPGGVYGNEHPETDPVWATGWDSKSLLLGVREPEKGWTFYRLPKASHSYDGAHGYNTEWPRIRDIGTPGAPEFLMTMHGMFWHFPATFCSTRSVGLRPRSAYLKVIGDFCRWNSRLVFGCDDSAQKEFLNVRSIKGSIKGPGQSNSNLWFTPPNRPDELGNTTVSGAVWMHDTVQAGERTEPYLFAGWKWRCLWLRNDSGHKARLTLEIDVLGSDKWSRLDTVSLNAGESRYYEFPQHTKGEWIRLSSSQSAIITAIFNYTGDQKKYSSQLFTGLHPSDSPLAATGGLLASLGNDKHCMGVLSADWTGSDWKETGYYELTPDMKLELCRDTLSRKLVRENYAIPSGKVIMDKASVLIIDDKGRRWRFPKGNEALSTATLSGRIRLCREVSTERDLFHLNGTFYELPAENADGFAKVRPIASHPYLINDYASYRGMLILTGINQKAKNDAHIIRSADGKASVWAGTIDDLWSMGKPSGKGGPWADDLVKAGTASDPYLIGFYDQKELRISHQSDKKVKFRLEVNPIGHGPWITYKEIEVLPRETFIWKFPASFQARWIRFTSDTDTRVTAELTYK